MSDRRSVPTKVRSKGRQDRQHAPRRKSNMSISPECRSRKGGMNTTYTLVQNIGGNVKLASLHQYHNNGNRKAKFVIVL